MAAAIVRATTHYNDPDEVARVSIGLGPAMRGIAVSTIDASQRLEKRGW
jgi:pyridoxal 5'-phosphate synthase pdxS subunit